MTGKTLFLACAAALAVLGALLYRPVSDNKRQVVVYSSVDADVALPIFADFTRETGIEVVHRLDSEETKTTGLAQRLSLMKDRPDGDVFWNSEQSMTLHLAAQGVLQSYVSPHAADIPGQYKDSQGLWTGFGCRVRVLVFNTQRVRLEDAPKSLDDFANPRWKGRIAIAKPLYGTTLSHLAALTLAIGEEKAGALFRAWRANAIIVAESNSDVVKRVVDGTADIGLTDNDDAFSAQERKQPIGLIVLDQTAEWPGAFLIPNTIAMLKNCPHPVEARAFIDYLLRPETEKRLGESGAYQIPVRDVGAKAPWLKEEKLNPAKVDWQPLAEKVLPLGERAKKLLTGEEQ
jgi:iron(III) transport system substrate-binding protein